MNGPYGFAGLAFRRRSVPEGSDLMDGGVPQGTVSGLNNCLLSEDRNSREFGHCLVEMMCNNKCSHVFFNITVRLRHQTVKTSIMTAGLALNRRVRCVIV